MVRVTQSRDGIRVGSVMREIASRLRIPSVMQLVGVVAKHLALSFDVVEDLYFLPSKLRNPDRACIGFGTRTADVPEQLDGEDRVR